MRIITWNCNGALRKKYQVLDELKADIYVVQECENPLEVKHDGYQKWSQNHLWIGDSKNKGLGIFAKDSIALNKLEWIDIYDGHISNSIPDHRVKYFLPCRIDEQYNLLGVWTHRNNSEHFGYIGQLWKYLQINQDKLGNCLIAGDFNSNVIWDKWDRWWNHSNVVSDLRYDGIESLYHLFTKEIQGEETVPTFYLQRKLEKHYHIDYIFGSKEWSETIIDCQIGQPEKWLEVSDHMPVVVDFNGK